MEYLAPGKSWVTAWAITCAVEWRRTWRPSSLLSVTMATAAWSGNGRPRSSSDPSTLAATAALARRLPIDAATSPAVVPAAYSRSEPSGREIVIWSLIARSVYGRPSHGLPSVLSLRIGRNRPRSKDRTVSPLPKEHLLGDGRHEGAVGRAQRAEREAATAAGGHRDELGQQPLVDIDGAV